MAEAPNKYMAQNESGFEDQVVKIYRCAKVVKGGRRFSFAALVVVGDREGNVGIGYGKANEVPNAVEKALKDARKNVINVALNNGTITHQVVGKCRATRVKLLPASSGTGVIAGLSSRAVLELAGVHNVLSKIYGSTSPKNVVKATLDGLRQLKSKEEVQTLRGVELEL